MLILNSKILAILSNGSDLNTSNVDIKLSNITTARHTIVYLNTSNVDIKLRMKWYFLYTVVYLNTSNVDIKHDGSKEVTINIPFKYI